MTEDFDVGYGYWEIDPAVSIDVEYYHAGRCTIAVLETTFPSYQKATGSSIRDPKDPEDKPLAEKLALSRALLDMGRKLRSDANKYVAKRDAEIKAAELARQLEHTSYMVNRVNDRYLASCKECSHHKRAHKTEGSKANPLKVCIADNNMCLCDGFKDPIIAI